MGAIKATQTMHLKPSQRLAGGRKEWHTRKRNGADVCYLILDRCGKVALLTQKLPLVSAFINANLVAPEEPWTRVNTTGMWEILNQTGGRMGGWHKGRWRVLSVELDQAPARFETVRREHADAVVIGTPECYCTV